MVADWIGAGRAIAGKYEFGTWYENNKSKQLIHEQSRLRIEFWINKCAQKTA